MYGYPQKSGVDPCNRVVLNTDTYSTPVHPMQNPTESDAALWVENVLHGIGDTGAPLFLKLLNSKIIFGGNCIAIFDGNIVFVRPKLLYQAMKGF